MIHRLPAYIIQARTIVIVPVPKTSSHAPFLLLLLGLMMAALIGCTSESSNLGQYKKGRTLHFSVVSLERTPELRYSTCDVLAGSNPPACDPSGTERDWVLTPSAEGMELVLVRAKIENHTAVSAILHVDKTGAELRDVGNSVYRPILTNEQAWRDFRGESEALVRMDSGECFDGPRTLLDAGSQVRWQSEYDDIQYLSFEDWPLGTLPEQRVSVAPGQSLSSTFDRSGTYSYTCGDSRAVDFPAELRVADPQVTYDYIERTTYFLLGSFELLQGHGLDGYLVFEAPVGTEFRDVRWRAGDSITFGF